MCVCVCAMWVTGLPFTAYVSLQPETPTVLFPPCDESSELCASIYRKVTRDQLPAAQGLGTFGALHKYWLRLFQENIYYEWSEMCVFLLSYSQFGMFSCFCITVLTLFTCWGNRWSVSSETQGVLIHLKDETEALTSCSQTIQPCQVNSE